MSGSRGVFKMFMIVLVVLIGLIREEQWTLLSWLRKWGLSGMRPKFSSSDNLEYVVRKNPHIKFNNNYNDPVGESHIGQTCTIEYGRFSIDNKTHSPTFAGATNIDATFADGTVIEDFPKCIYNQ